MNAAVQRWLRFADRALRPKAAAVRVLSSEVAASNALIQGLAADIRTAVAELRAAANFPSTDPSAAGESSIGVPILAAAGQASARIPIPAAAGQASAEMPLQDPDSTPGNNVYDLWTAEVIRRVLSQNPGTAIDVGAHHGDILQSMIAAAPDAHHYAFEPIPAMAAELTERFPAVTVHQVALAAEPGASQFHHVVSNPGYSGILRRRYDRPHEEVQLIGVELRRLDDSVDPGDAVRLIKIDVEGAELGVLRGARRTLATWKPVVVFEFGLGGSDFYGTTPELIYSEFAQHGLSVTLLNRWLSGAEPLTLAEFDRQFHTGLNYYFLAYPAA